MSVVLERLKAVKLLSQNLYKALKASFVQIFRQFHHAFESLPKGGFLSLWAGQPALLGWLSALWQGSPLNYLYLQTIHR